MKSLLAFLLFSTVTRAGEAVVYAVIPERVASNCAGWRVYDHTATGVKKVGADAGVKVTKLRLLTTEGAHTFEARTFNAAGKESTGVSCTFTLTITLTSP